MARRRPEPDNNSTRLGVLIVFLVLGVLGGGIIGFIIQFVDYQKGNRMSDGQACGIMVGGALIGGVLGGLAAMGLNAVFFPPPRRRYRVEDEEEDRSVRD